MIILLVFVADVDDGEDAVSDDVIVSASESAPAAPVTAAELVQCRSSWPLSRWMMMLAR